MRWLINIGLVLMTVSLGLAILFTKKYLRSHCAAYCQLDRHGPAASLPEYDDHRFRGKKSQRGMITSLYSSLRFLGVAAGPPLFGFLMDISDKIVFITVSCLSLITLGLVFFLIKPQGKIS